MSKDEVAPQESVRSCWRNCGVAPDAEMREIDAMEDALAPLDEQVMRLRERISGFEACYHEADVEAIAIAEGIGAGRCPEASEGRPPKRLEELEHCRAVLSRWCQVPDKTGIELKVGDLSAVELLRFLGQATTLKVWQVQRMVDKITEALDPSRSYHWMKLNVGDYGEPEARAAGEHYVDDWAFLQQTRETFLHDTVDGRPATISLAMAIDLLMPCHWDFVGSVATLLKAIGGDLHPAEPYACCARNLRLSPLCAGLRTISDALRVFWKGDHLAGATDRQVLAPLGTVTPDKRWLVASMDKTIRLQLEAPPDMWLDFG